MDLPDGIIDSAELFLESMRIARIQPGTEQDERDAVKFLEQQFAETLAKIDHFWQSNERHYRMAFWTAALLGERIATHGYKKRLAQLAYNNAVEAGTFSPLPPAQEKP